MPNRSGPIRTKARSWRFASLACTAALACSCWGCGIPTDGEPRALPERVGPSRDRAGYIDHDWNRCRHRRGVRLVLGLRLKAARAGPALDRLVKSHGGGRRCTCGPDVTGVRAGPNEQDSRGDHTPQRTNDRFRTISVNLSAKLNQLNAQAQRGAFAQIVLTASQISRVDRVPACSSIDGSPVDVTSPEGQTTEVSPCDFRDVLANDEVMSATGRTERGTEYGRNITRVLNSLCLE